MTVWDGADKIFNGITRQTLNDPETTAWKELDGIGVFFLREEAWLAGRVTLSVSVLAASLYPPGVVRAAASWVSTLELMIALLIFITSPVTTLLLMRTAIFRRRG
jgi:hypothetical protein